MISFKVFHRFFFLIALCIISASCGFGWFDYQPGTSVSFIVESGLQHTCVVYQGNLRCFGRNNDGRLGYNTTTTVGNGVGPSITAAGNVNVGGSVASVSLGTDFTCALLSDGNVRCWGIGTTGRLGYGNTNNVGDGVGVSIVTAGNVSIGGSVTKISSSDGGFSCVVLSNSKVRCWGDCSNYGQCGYNNTTVLGDNEAPSTAGDVAVGGNVQSVVTGTDHTCALLTSGSVRCWGRNNFGQLGYNNTTNVGDGIGPAITTAGDVTIGATVAQLSAGNQFTCALLTNGKVRCWGRNDTGQLGYNNTTNVGDGIGPAITTAGDVAVGGNVQKIASGDSHTCAYLTDNTVRCWGSNTSGQLGYNNTTTVANGIGPSITTAGNVNIGKSIYYFPQDLGLHTCVGITGFKLRCWGMGNFGQVDHDSTSNVSDGIGPTIIAAGDITVF